MPRRPILLSALTFCLLAATGLRLAAEPPTRAEALAIALSYVDHQWQSSTKNVLHGNDTKGIEVHTPDREGGYGSPAGDCWTPDTLNVGVAYKWGGFDTPQSFDAGISAGKAAGDVYSAEKRALGGKAVTHSAVGIDCSGFVSRCWKLAKKHSTSMLAEISAPLASPSELEPADAMNVSEGHILLFVRWMDNDKRRALFYEAAPFSRTRADVRYVNELLAAGFKPIRYRAMRD